MDKRTFLKTSSLLAGGAILARFFGCASTDKPLSNWAGNLRYSTDNVHYPRSVEEVQEIVKKCDKLKALGSQHSFNRIADSTANQISLKRLNNLVSLDKRSNTVTVQPGMKYGELCRHLHENGYALHNLASLPHISIAGSCATATHGSGMKNGNLATGVSAITFVNAAGELVALSRQTDEERFQGAVVGLGGLGVTTELTLNLQPAFDVKQVVYRNLPMEVLRSNFNEVMSSGYSVSLFTNWENKNINQVWIKSRIDQDDSTTTATEFYGAQPATRNMHPVDDQSAETCTEQMGVPGPWYERLPHFKMGFMPSTGEELQSEYFVPIEHAYDAMAAIEELHEQISPHLFVSEIRTVDADQLWMSPCYNTSCVTLHTTWKQDWDTVIGLLPLIEERLAPFSPVPHWGKLFTLSPLVLQSRYSKIAEFRELVDQYDPEGKFRNEFLSRNIFGE
jgi:xylitol oxidase